MYEASPRPYPERVPEPEYDSGLHAASATAWSVLLKHQDVFLSETLSGESIGLEQIDDRKWCVYLAAFPIARFDSARLFIEPLPPDAEMKDGGNLALTSASP